MLQDSIYAPEIKRSVDGIDFWRKISPSNSFYAENGSEKEPRCSSGAVIVGDSF